MIVIYLYEWFNLRSAVSHQGIFFTVFINKNKYYFLGSFTLLGSFLASCFPYARGYLK